MSDSIWCWAPIVDGQLPESSLEAICECRKIAGADGRVTAFLTGPNAEPNAQTAIEYGSDVVVLADDETFDRFNAEAVVGLICGWAQDAAPQAVLVMSTPEGTVIAPRVSTRMKWRFAPNVLKAERDAKGAWSIRVSLLANKANKQVSFPGKATVVMTISPGSVGVGKRNKRRTGSVQTSDSSTREAGFRVVGTEKADYKLVALDEAERVVAFGNGVVDDAGRKLMDDLSAALEAALGGSKPIADKGWLPYSRLIGQSSGRRVKARLFVGVGVSGSTHFLEGMKDSDTIVSINKEKGAPFSKKADLALVGDLYEIVPLIIEQLNMQKGGEQGV